MCERRSARRRGALRSSCSSAASCRATTGVRDGRELWRERGLPPPAERDLRYSSRTAKSGHGPARVVGGLSVAAPYKLHGGDSTTRSLHAWNECTKREYAKDVHDEDHEPALVVAP